MAPPQRSRPGLLTRAGCGGLYPDPASRVREASLPFSHLLRRLLPHTEISDPQLIRSRGHEVAIHQIARPIGVGRRLGRDRPRAAAARSRNAQLAHQLPEDEAKRVLTETSVYAAAKLAEVEARTHFVHEIRGQES